MDAASSEKNSKLQAKLTAEPSVIGIDIGTSSVNVAQMGNYRGVTTLIKTAVVNIATHNQIDRKTATLEALKTALVGFGLSKAKIVCVVNCPQTYARKLFTPLMPSEELETAIQLEAKRIIPFPLDDAVWDFSVKGTVMERGIEKLKIVFAAAPKEDRKSVV